MKLLLDEHLPRPLKRDFSTRLEVSTVPDEGWDSLQNGALMKAMTQRGFTHLVTADRMEYQQNLDKYPIKLVVLITHDNRYKTLRAKAVTIEEAVSGSDQKLIHVDLR